MPTTQTNTDLYTTDFYAWGLATAALIRAKQWEDIDLEALAEELEGLARSEKRELENRLEELLMHLLKWQYQPQKRQEGHSWLDSVRKQRGALARFLRDHHALRTQVPEILDEIYPGARAGAIEEMEDRGPLRRHEIARHPLPLTCPWTDAQVLDDDFWPAPEA